MLRVEFDSMTTLTTEVSSIQIKVLYLHFRSVKINADIERINSTYQGNPKSAEAIEGKGEIAFDIVDIISLFENYNSLVNDIYKFESISRKLTSELRRELNDLRNATSKWKYIRNKIGGHLDIEPIQKFCLTYNYSGVFISNELEADFKGILLLQMIESAINSTLVKSKLFENQLTLTTPQDLNKLIVKLHSDWKLCFDIFHSLMRFLYSIGKDEKLKAIAKEDIGLIKF